MNLESLDKNTHRIYSKPKPLTMPAYSTNKLVYDSPKKTWEVHIEYYEASGGGGGCIIKLIVPVEYQKSNIDMNNAYRYCAGRHMQIDKKGKLVAAYYYNVRRGRNMPLTLEESGNERYAHQSDFDKMCYENPDPRFPYDWNAEVWKKVSEIENN